METQTANSPDKVSNPADPGDDTQRRFRYQHAYGVVLIGNALSEKPRFTAIWCEHHEDFLAERADKLFEGFQIKTRKPRYGPWKCKDGPFLKSLGRFADLETEFPDKFDAFHFVTNAPFEEGKKAEDPTSPIQLRRAVKSATSLGDLSPVFHRAVAGMAKKLDKSSEQLFAVVKKVRLVVPFPSLEDFDSVLVHRVIPAIPGFKGLSAGDLDAAKDALIELVHRASALAENDIARFLQDVTGPDSEQAEFRAKRISVEVAWDALSRWSKPPPRSEKPVRGDFSTRIEVTREGGTRLPENFLLRWAASRQAGRVAICGIAAEELWAALCAAEKDYFAPAFSDASLPRREWWKLSQLPRPPNLGTDFLKEIARETSGSGDAQAQLASGAATLGIVVDGELLTRSDEEVAVLVRWLDDAERLLVTYAPLLIVTMPSSTRHAKRLVADATSVLELPPEVVCLLPAIASPRPPDHVAKDPLFGPPLAPNAALAFWLERHLHSQTVDHGDLRAVRELAGLDEFDRATLPSELPSAIHVVADLARAGERRGELTSRLLALLASVAPSATQSLVGALAGSGDALLRRLALQACKGRTEFLVAWLEGVPPAERAALPGTTILINPGTLRPLLESLACVAVRRKREHGPLLDDGTLRTWLGMVADPTVRGAALAALDSDFSSNARFWRAPSDEALAALAVCAPDADFSIDELPPELWSRPGFWAFIEALPLSAPLLQRLVRLPPEIRAIIGLCSSVQWSELAQSGSLGERLAHLRRIAPMTPMSHVR